MRTANKMIVKYYCTLYIKNNNCDLLKLSLQIHQSIISLFKIENCIKNMKQAIIYSLIDRTAKIPPLVKVLQPIKYWADVYIAPS